MAENDTVAHPGTTRRVILMVWDGMRPDFVSDDRTPHLRRLMTSGTTYARAVGVLPSVTRPTTTSVTTGAYPAAHGIYSNLFTGPKGDRAAVDTGDRASLERLRAVNSSGRIVPLTTLPEALVAGGRRVVSMGSGSTGQVTMLDPERVGTTVHILFTQPVGTTVHILFTQPVALMETLTARIGPVPERHIPVQEANDWLVRALTDYVLPEIDPDVVLIWLCEPDASQHAKGLGAPESDASIRGNDARLGRILDAIDTSDVPTTVIVASDHGHSTVTGMVRISDALTEAGFGATMASGVMHISEKAIIIEAEQPDADLPTRVGQWLIAQPYIGAVIDWTGTHTVPGALAPSDVYGPRPRPKLSHTPTFSWSWRWNDTDTNEHGVQGTAYSGFTEGLADFDRLQGHIVGLNRLTSTHGTLAPADQRTVLVLGGAGIRPGTPDLPAGVVDIAPTILALLGLPPLPDADGRALTEAFIDGPAPASVAVHTETLATLPNGSPLRRHTIGTTAYVDTTTTE